MFEYEAQTAGFERAQADRDGDRPWECAYEAEVVERVLEILHPGVRGEVYTHPQYDTDSVQHLQGK